MKRARRGRCLAFGSLAIAVALFSGTGGAATPCLADIDKYCANVPTGGGRIQDCLKNHEKDLSPQCAGRHEDLEKEMGRLAATCRYDISRFCWDVSPGRGRVARCLEEHRSDLSPTCNDQLGKASDPGGR